MSTDTTTALTPLTAAETGRLASQKRLRASAVANGTQEVTRLDELLSQDSVSVTAVRESVTKLKQYHDKVLQYTENVQELLTQNAELAHDGNTFEPHIKTLLDSHARGLAVIQSLETPTTERTGDAGSLRNSREDLGNGPTGSHTSLPAHTHASLPKINDMRYFSGDLLDWIEFWDWFENTVHNADISAVHKFTYLKHALKKDAAKVVANYRLTSACYEEAVQQLKQRYGNTEVIKCQHFEALISLPPSNNQIDNLQRTVDEVELHIRSLVALGVSEDTFGLVFCPILLAKLPPGIRIELQRKQGLIPWTLARLRELLREELMARDLSYRLTTHRPQPSEPPRQNNSGYFRNRSSGSALVTSEKPTTGHGKAKKDIPRKRSCIFCNGDHYNDACTVVTEVTDRVTRLSDRCLKCLRRSHRAEECRTSFPCAYCNSREHNRCLCPKRGFSVTSTFKAQPAKPTKGKAGTASVATRGKRGILHTALASVSGTKSSVRARLMLDSGATDSFIRIGLANKIGAQKIGREVVDHGAFEGKRMPEQRSVFAFRLQLSDGSEMEVQAYGSEQITPDIYKPAIDVTKHPILAHVPLAEPLVQEGEMITVDLLLGTDYREEIVREERLSLGDDLYLLDSKLGYVITGRVNDYSGAKSTTTVCAARNSDPHVDFERLYSLDQIGIRDTKETNDDEESVASFNRSLLFDSSERRYYAKWPVRQIHQTLPSNFGVAYGRLRSFKRKADEMPQLLEKTKEIFDDQMSKEVIEVAPQIPDGEHCHYLPFQAVVTPDKTTTKCRIVYDASSRANKQLPSLNDTLYRGPVLLENLISLILRFRLQPVGIVSDIEKAFLQIGLQKPDRDLVRFLWLRNPDKPVTEDNLVVMRFRRVCFGAVSSPFILAATVDHHLKGTGTRTAREIARNIYVDNVIHSVPSSLAAKSYYTEAKHIFNRASMNLREWFSNDKAFADTIPEADRGEGDSTKVLGLRWNLKQDTLICPFKGAEHNDKPTKRFVLHVLAKVYDPCGFFTPVTSPGKWILQELWLQNLGWDEAIPECLVNSWKRVTNSLNQLPECLIPRCYDYTVNLSKCVFELHAFCDASERAYGAAFYLVMKPHTSQPISNLIFSKCRVSPIKKQKQTIPRLELLAATIGARLLEFLVDALGVHISAKFLWSDSKCVLYWILRTPVSTVFVRNRVDSIRKVSGVDYRYVPSADNPADLPTRGTSTDELKTHHLWWHGPPWLLTPDAWPETPTKSVEFQPEQSDAVIFMPMIATITCPPPDLSDYLVDPSRFSSLDKLLRVTAWIKRFLWNCKTKAHMQRHPSSGGHHPSGVSERTYLLAAELKDARRFWEKSVQQHHFAEFLTSNGKQLGSLKSLAPLVLDPGGIIRCVSRLQQAQIPEAAKSPKLLPKKDPFTRLVIQHYHVALNHVGIKHTLAELRCEYWIIQGRSQVKQVIRRCSHCQHVKGKPFQMPEMPTLSEFRVSQRAPFACTGLDYLGPLHVFPKIGASTKVWICLFTCANTRAVHLEVVSSMNTIQFLLALRRFVSLYGTPELLVSDNAGQFHTSRRVLDKLWQDACEGSNVREFSTSKGIDWKFITQAAPWMGGFYERLVGLVKSNLNSALFRQRLDLVELQTVVSEVSTIVNSRPLVYCEGEVGDEALTPAHLLMRHRSVTPLMFDSDSTSATRSEWILAWKRIQNILSRFWKSWQKQYLLSLRETSRLLKQRNVLTATPKVGEVVLIAKERMPRSAWKYGRVTELIMSADNRCRSVKLLLPGGIPLTRPIKLLYPLELREEQPQSSLTAGSSGFDQAKGKPSDATTDLTALNSYAVSSPGPEKAQYNTREPREYRGRVDGASRVGYHH